MARETRMENEIVEKCEKCGSENVEVQWAPFGPDKCAEPVSVLCLDCGADREI
jgi:hypothetical protein